MLNLSSFFHLNLMYSSIDVDQREEVIRRCYHPLLDLATPRVPITLEATGLTLEIVRELDGTWLHKLREKVRTGAVEFVGSGYSQIIGPLVPGRVNRANLRLARDVYGELLDIQPRIWLVNEMAYSGGLPQLLAEIEAEAMVMEWNNTWKGHPEWNPEYRYHHQLARGCEGTALPVLWIDTIAFQKFQRMASDHLDLPEWLEHWRELAGATAGGNRFAALYGSDAEVFDFRPGRYFHEGDPAPAGEWERIAEALARLAGSPGIRMGPLSAALEEDPSPVCGVSLRLECTRQPVVVKKQEKYNLNRWALTGRGDLEANTACHRLASAMADRNPPSTDGHWRELLYLWSSDFRTHITPGRWEEFRTRLRSLPGPGDGTDTAQGEPVAVDLTGRRLALDTGPVKVELDLTRGLSLHSLVFPMLGKNPVLGTLPHGYFDDIAFGADFFTGHSVVQYPSERKLTDLQPCGRATRVRRMSDGGLAACTVVTDGIMKVVKRVELAAGRPELVLSGSLRLPSRRPGEIHPVHLTVVPGLFDVAALHFRTHNGGLSEERFALTETGVHHGAPYSTLVTAKGGLGATEGVVAIGDDRGKVVIGHDTGLSALIPTLRFEEVRGGGYFLRLRYSAQEIDETFVARDEPWQLAWRVTITASLEADAPSPGEQP